MKRLMITVAMLAACTGGEPKSNGPESDLGSDMGAGSDTTVASDDTGGNNNGGDDGGPQTDATPPDVSGSGELAEAVTLMQRLGGLWVGPATQTPLGEFPIMPMDFRAADPDVLFARVDLDADNALRMAFFIEEIGGEKQFVFRNGGLFMGLSRDTKMVLESYDAAADSWRFCEPEMGCDYVDALITFDGEDAMTMDVKVRGAQHMLWTPDRRETRELPSPFPSSLDPIGTGDAEFPPMPTLTVNLSWDDPAPDGAWVWVILSDTPCGLSGTECQSSRSMGMALEPESTSATLEIDQLHPADYHLNAILDRDGNFRTSPFPNTGDAIVFPVDPVVTVGEEGTETSHTISVDVP